MAIGPVVTRGYGTFGTVNLVVTRGYGTAGVVPVAAVTTPQVGSVGRRRRQRILLKIDGQNFEVQSLAVALEIIKAAKAEVPQVARVTAEQIVSQGKRIGEARREEAEAVELVSAPSSVREIIEDRIDEMQRFYWTKVEQYVKALDDDDEEVMMLL